MSCTLTLKNIAYRLHSQELFDGININLKHKEKIGILGNNGCGKSTLLKIAAGLLQPHQGSVELFHTPISSSKAYEPFRNQVGYLCQNSDDHFIAPTVIEDIAFSLMAYGKSKTEARKISLDMLETLGLVNLAEKVPMHLSGGQKRIVALAGVLVIEPKILLLDEPESALDAQSTETVIELLNQTDASMLLVSHDKEFLNAVTPTQYTLDRQLLPI